MRFQVMSMLSVHRPHFEQQVTRYWVTAVLCMLRRVRSTKWIVTSFTEINDRILFWQLIRKIYQRFQITFQCFCRWDFHLDWPRVSQALCNFSHNILGGGPRDSTHVISDGVSCPPFSSFKQFENKCKRILCVAAYHSGQFLKRSSVLFPLIKSNSCLAGMVVVRK